MIVNHLLTALLIIVLPIRVFYDHLALTSSTNPIGKRNSYYRFIVMFWALTVGAGLVYGLGQLFFYSGDALVFDKSKVAVTIIVILLLIQVFLPVALSLHKPSREAMRESYSSRLFALPVTMKEKWLFAFVAVTAGICEEFLYRAFLPQYIVDLQPGVPWELALLIAATLFGLGHFLQGLGSIFQAMIAAILYSYLYYATGSLLVPIILHILFNLRMLWISRLIR